MDTCLLDLMFELLILSPSSTSIFFVSLWGGHRFQLQIDQSDYDDRFAEIKYLT